ncbi:MAG TPA: alanine--tRNA ligase [Vicinamibacterales bacterium]|jgi:alanyl-tRNA synthetase|nr:alanine--tRNA ligase [Vicinamibacterales bacterium]
MTSAEIRASFLKYFERQGHRIVPSSSLVPHDDPSLLFTNAGMNQFKDVFLGKEQRGYRRAASSQKCMRVSGKHNDLDNVGPSLRHHTFFEMLGNFSFGDYFKREAIPFAWELLTSVWKLPPDRLYPTIFKGEGGIPRDEEAHAAWTGLVRASRISELGLAENFWAMGDTGPCGRCSEIHYFRGNEIPCPEPVCRGLDCSCDRYVEIWNNVFMEFDRQPDGELRPLPALSVDTGMGLERITAVLQGKIANYDTDLFTPLLAAIGERSGRRYRATIDDPDDVSMRVIADHIRATTFLIADGVVPSNEWRGYVLRKIMRRAMRHGKKLRLTEPFLHTLVDVLVREMGDAYPELGRNRDSVVQVIRNEEDRFDAVLNAGLPRLEAAIDRALGGNRVIPGEEIFRLYDSLGMPLDFVEDIAAQRGVGLDREGYERAMEGQREKARAGSAFEAKRAIEFEYESDAARAAALAPGDRFEGYTTTRATDVPIVAIFDASRRQTTALGPDAEGFLVLERSPFYLEAGGQVSDSGRISSESGGSTAVVQGLTRLAPGGPRAHRVRVERGTLREGDQVTAEVDDAARDATRRNHTATHLLHAALRHVLGSHVKQAGSLVAPDRLRFDFVHFAPLNPDELNRIERLVNEQIYRNTPVQTEVRDTQEAIAGGAMALFGEKYGDRVRVVTVPGFSVELCGGTHCRATGDIGFFAITQETGVAAGVRRIEALTGEGAVRHYESQRDALASMLEAIGAAPDQAMDAVRRLQSDIKRLQRENEQLKMRAALGGAGSAAAADDTVDIDGVKLVARKVAGLEKGALRGLSDSLRDRLPSGVVVLASDNDGKVALIVSVTKDLAGRVHAGNVVKRIAPIVGGGGGGRPDFAEAGGKDAGRIDELLAKSRDVVREMLGQQN